MRNRRHNGGLKGLRCHNCRRKCTGETHQPQTSVGQLRDTLPGTVTSYLVLADASRFDDYANAHTVSATIASAGLNPQQRIQMLETALAHERQMLTGA